VVPSSAWSGGAVSWYGLYGSPAVYRWREPVVFRTLARNRQATVPGVHYPDRTNSLNKMNDQT
jgi:hypothetical protein